MRTRVIAVFAVLAAAAMALLPRMVERSAPTAAAHTPPPVAPGIPVTAGTVAVADVPVFLNGIGAVQAFNMVTIKSRVDGQIVGVAFTEGQEVKAGAPLLQIDPRLFQAALEQAPATKERDEAQLVSAAADLARWAELVVPGFKSRQTYAVL